MFELPRGATLRSLSEQLSPYTWKSENFENNRSNLVDDY